MEWDDEHKICQEYGDLGIIDNLPANLHRSEMIKAKITDNQMSYRLISFSHIEEEFT